MHKLAASRVGVLGLGYVGLPLAIEFSKHFPVVAFDLDAARLSDLRNGCDHTREVAPEILAAAVGIQFTDNPALLRGCNVFIVTVPTPMDDSHRPDFGPLSAASATVALAMCSGALVIFESTVYPGATEEVCVPLLEQHSGLGYNQDFYVGYSPERVNPGDREHRLSSIKKVTSGSTPEAARFVDSLYGTVITAGTHPVSSIRVAEATKVVENTQRDLNIALMNELAIICNRLKIDTTEVLEAAGTKWNFLPFRPGLVGGHCIGVDPYYLTYKAERLGYHPEVILAGRRINDGMAIYVAGEVIKLMTRRKLAVADSRILVLGLAFKEGLPDIRNSKVVDMVRELQSYGATVDIYDPWISCAEAHTRYAITPLEALPEPGTYDAIVIAVAHPEFSVLGAPGMHALGKSTHVLYDVKAMLGAHESDGRL